VFFPRPPMERESVWGPPIAINKTIVCRSPLEGCVPLCEKLWCREKLSALHYIDSRQSGHLEPQNIMLDAPRGILLKFHLILDKKRSELESYMYIESDSFSSTAIFNGKFSDKMANECSQKFILTSHIDSQKIYRNNWITFMLLFILDTQNPLN